MILVSALDRRSRHCTAKTGARLASWAQSALSRNLTAGSLARYLKVKPGTGTGDVTFSRSPEAKTPGLGEEKTQRRTK